MPAMRRGSRTLQAPAGTHNGDDQQAPQSSTQTQTISEYEQSREERIRQNLQKMQKLGIFDLSSKLNSQIRPKRARKDPSLHKSTPASSPLPPPGPVRRSSRLQNVTPLSYTEVDAVKEDKRLLKNKDIVLEVGSQPETYTEEHDKLLGSTEKTWVLFVDGYGKDGKRIYDPVKGKTCHQCRQKTLGYRTHCCKCNMVQGQFCGDCLYMRYGEHVLEALENPDWVCPVCRGICNCSLCRQAKGWAPTGILYKKISSLGYKSVAHYLIQTHRRETDFIKVPDTTSQVSAKRSLQFTEKDALSKVSPTVNIIDLGSPEQSVDELKSEKENKMQSVQNQDSNYPISAKRSLPFSDMGPLSQNVGPWKVGQKVADQFGLLTPKCENVRDDFKSEKEKEIYGIQQVGCDTAFSKHKRKPAQTIEPSMNTIAGRLSQRRRKGNHDDNDLQKPKEEVLYCKDGINEILTGKEVEQEKEQRFTGSEHDIHCVTVLEGNPKMKKPSLAIKPNSGSSAGRLKLRSSNYNNGGQLPRVNDSISDIQPEVENVPSVKKLDKVKEALQSEMKLNGASNNPLENLQCLISDIKLEVQIVPSDKELEKAKDALQSVTNHDSGSNTLMEHGKCHKQDKNEIMTGKEVEQWKEQPLMGNKYNIDCDTWLEEKPEMKRPLLATNINSDSIAGRLRLRSRNRGACGDLPRLKDGTSDVKQEIENVPSNKEAKKDKETLLPDIKHDGGSNTPSEISPKMKHKRALANAPNSDSIAGRLRQRRTKAGGHDAGSPVMLTDGVQVGNMSLSASPVPGSDSIAGRLKLRRRTM